MDHSEELEQPRPFTAVEFCAGYAGVHLGLARAIPNLRLIALSEIEAFACANLVAKMEAGLLDPAPVWPDLKTFPNREFHGKVDLLVAGFPCQPFSAAGKRGGSDDPRHLFPYIKQSLIDMRPGGVWLENVEGIISAKLGEGWDDPAGTPVLLHVLRELERVGYRATAGIFSAAEVGAPHQRKRVFILGVADSRCSAGSESQQPAELRPARTGESSSNSRLLSRGSKGEGSEVSVWPSRPGEQQYDWEPPRVVAQPDGKRPPSEQDRGANQRTSSNNTVVTSGGATTKVSETQSPLGRNADGSADRLDDAELLYASSDNRVDELRLLGNGVVPATAERAWRVLSQRLANTSS